MIVKPTVVFLSAVSSPRPVFCVRPRSTSSSSSFTSKRICTTQGDYHKQMQRYFELQVLPAKCGYLNPFDCWSLSSVHLTWRKTGLTFFFFFMCVQASFHTLVWHNAYKHSSFIINSHLVQNAMFDTNATFASSAFHWRYNRQLVPAGCSERFPCCWCSPQRAQAPSTQCGSLLRPKSSAEWRSLCSPRGRWTCWWSTGNNPPSTSYEEAKVKLRSWNGKLRHLIGLSLQPNIQNFNRLPTHNAEN